MFIIFQDILESQEQLDWMAFQVNKNTQQLFFSDLKKPMMNGTT